MEMQPRSLIFKVTSPLFYQLGQGKARLRPSSTSYRLARQLTPTNAQARKGVRFCLRTTLQEVCWILGGGTSALFFKSQLSERQKAASSGFWKMVLAESRRLRSSRRRSPAADRTALPSGPSPFATVHHYFSTVSVLSGQAYSSPFSSARRLLSLYP